VRLKRGAGAIRSAPPTTGQHTDTALAAWGFEAEEIATLRAAGAVG
jgi:crotonobetainyl-CoA:carnitine CoA-transferase CaiB-like acyl-CoA transferase